MPNDLTNLNTQNLHLFSFSLLVQIKSQFLINFHNSWIVDWPELSVNGELNDYFSFVIFQNNDRLVVE